MSQRARLSDLTMILLSVQLLLIVTHVQAYENLALQRPAWQAHNFPDPDKDVAWGANKSVDGQYSNRSAGGNQCTISDPGHRTATLRVDLQRVVSISHINIFYRTDNKPSPGAYYDRFAGFFLYVSNTTSKDDGHLCFHELQNGNGTPIENQTINCPVYGRYAIYYNERRQGVTYPSYYSRFAYNEICELEVYGCGDSGKYGENCDRKCPENCQEGRCIITTGDCLGCIPGYQGLRCNILCGKYTYGLECALSCGNCSDGETCYHVNGTCLNGCSEGAEGGKCQNVCPSGYFGKGCSHECSKNCGVPRRCDRFTGECEGGCQRGWKGIRCDQKCDSGLYGVYCNLTCGHCINDTRCHHINGTCLHGCSSGYVEPLCINVCSRSYWGVNCKESCSTECVSQTCHHESGVCLTSVKSQKISETCNTDHTATIASILISVLIVITGSVLNYLFWRRNQDNTKEIKGIGHGDNSNVFSAVDIAAEHRREGDKITSPYAELGTLDKPSTYEELQHYASPEEKM